MQHNKETDSRTLQLSQKAKILCDLLEGPEPFLEIVKIISKDYNLTSSEAEELIKKFVSAKFLLEGDYSLRNQSAVYSNTYKLLDNHRLMLLDQTRTASFQKAIQEVVSKGSTVIDVGAGSGILSFFCADAGANKVYAIEATPIVESAKKICKINKLDHVVEFFNGYAQNFETKEKADVIVSEWIGFFAMEEYMFDAVQAVRDKFLKEGGQMIPKALDLFILPIEDFDLYRTHGFGLWESPFFGYDFSLGKSESSAQKGFIVTKVSDKSPLAPPAKLVNFDCSVDTTEKFHFTKTVDWTMNRPATFHGFAGYFDLILTDSLTMSTSPSSNLTHWKQSYFPIEQIQVEANDKIELTITTRRGSVVPEIYLEGNIYRNEKIINSFKNAYVGKSLYA